MNDPLAKLLDDCKELKMLEKKAAELYQDLIKHVDDPNDKSVLNRIIKDELRHADITQQIINILNKNK